MMSNKIMKMAVLAAVLAMVCTMALKCIAAEPKTRPWDQIPAAVQATILANGGTAGPVDKENAKKDGKDVYEAPAKDKDSNRIDIVVNEDGKLLEIKTDDAADRAKEIEAKLPEPVLKTFKKTFPKGEIFKLDVDVENGVTVYDLEFKDGKIEKETDITADGTMLEFTVVVEAKAVPKAAMKAIRKAAEGTTIKRIEQIEISYETKDGKAIKLPKLVKHYAIEIAKGDQTTEFVVDPDGKMLEPVKWDSAKEQKAEDKGKAESKTGQ